MRKTFYVLSVTGNKMKERKKIVIILLKKLKSETKEKKHSSSHKITSKFQREKSFLLNISMYVRNGWCTTAAGNKIKSNCAKKNDTKLNLREKME